MLKLLLPATHMRVTGNTITRQLTPFRSGAVARSILPMSPQSFEVNKQQYWFRPCLFECFYWRPTGGPVFFLSSYSWKVLFVDLVEFEGTIYGHYDGGNNLSSFRKVKTRPIIVFIITYVSTNWKNYLETPQHVFCILNLDSSLVWSAKWSGKWIWISIHWWISRFPPLLVSLISLLVFQRENYTKLSST